MNITGSTKINYTTTNITNNYLRGLDLGVGIAAFLFLLGFRRNLTVANITLGMIVTITGATQQITSYLFDIYAPVNCYLRVKLIYSLEFLQNMFYWIFQANIVSQVCRDVKSIPGTPYIGIGTFLARVGVGIWTLFDYTYSVDTNLVCISVLDPQTNLIKILAEILYNLTMAVLAVYPMIYGMRSLNSLKQNNNGYTSALVNNHVDANVGWLKQIIKRKTFVLVLAVVLDVAHIICIYESKTPSFVSVINPIFQVYSLLDIVILLISDFSPNTSY
ncbi:hypothetical protein HK100_012242 [Physocladia obscura]|uniref:Uncharacterized protein n=1 Tax=Physocladia obscura TaxID=109957 RepID=A0AAD5T023_9FUNG|nr:hypothetical protein HK100_012242 [Physocladia obscura]